MGFLPVTKLTIGRIVHYHDFEGPTYPAVVVQVFNNSSVCMLCVMKRNGIDFLPAEYSEEPKPGYWTWPKIEGDET